MPADRPAPHPQRGLEPVRRPVSQRALDLTPESVTEDRRVEAPGVLQAVLGVDRVGVEGEHRRRQLLRPAVPPAAGLALDHVLEQASGRASDHGASRRLSLDGSDSELLARRHDECPAGGHQVSSLRVGNSPRERDRRAREALEPPPDGSVACDHERQAQPVEGPDGDVDLLVRDELGDDQVAASRPARPEARGVDRWVDDA